MPFSSCLASSVLRTAALGPWRRRDIALAAQVNAADVLARCVGEKVEDAADAVRLFRAAMPHAAVISRQRRIRNGQIV